MVGLCGSVGTTWTWIEDEEEGEVFEDAVFVTADKEDEKKLFDLLKELCKKYNQDGFSWKPAGENKYLIIDENGKTLMSFDNVAFNNLADVYTKMKNNKGSFVFERAYTKAGFIGHMLKKEE